jgi:hypothetical protein
MSTKDPATYIAALAEADDAWFRDELAYAWRTAQDDAVGAYRAWQESRGPSEYALYRAAQDRADQAQDVLASNARARSSERLDANGAHVVTTAAPSKVQQVQIP